MGGIFSTASTKSWQGCEWSTGILMLRGWDVKIIEPLWKVIRQFLTKLPYTNGLSQLSPALVFTQEK